MFSIDFIIKKQVPPVSNFLRKLFCDHQMIPLASTVIYLWEQIICHYQRRFLVFQDLVYDTQLLFRVSPMPYCHILLRKPDSYCSTFSYLSHERKCLYVPCWPTPKLKSGELTVIMFFFIGWWLEFTWKYFITFKRALSYMKSQQIKLTMAKD